MNRRSKDKKGDTKVKKKIFCIAAGIALVIAAFTSGRYAGAASKTPGSAGDPLLTLSYLEKRLEEYGNACEKVTLSRGQTLTGVPGTEFVILGGSVTALGAGVVDITEGRLTEEDTSLFLYHKYILTEDGSGCEALSAATVLIYGKYEKK